MPNDPLLQLELEEVMDKIPSAASDKEFAAQYRDEVSRALQPVLEILDRAKAQGLVLGFNIKQDPIGRNIIDFVSIARHY